MMVFHQTAERLLPKTISPSNEPKRMTKENEAWQKEIAQVKSLEPIAQKLGCDLATLAMAWMISNSNVTSAITGCIQD